MVRAVLKFGGGVLKDEGAFERIAGILQSNASRENALVVSAHSGVTDALLDAANRAVSEKEFIPELIGFLRKKHIVAGVDEPALDEKLKGLKELLLQVNLRAYLSTEQKERITSYGERLSAFCLASYLNAYGIKAMAVDSEEAGILSDGVLEHAACRLEQTVQNMARLEKFLREGTVLVITGYYGIDAEGRVNTFGRGGTDYSAGVVAACLDADVLEIWKDVDGFMSCDPKAVQGAVRLDEITFREAKELGYFGAKILHPRALDCLDEASAKVFIKSVLNPSGRGTELVRKCSVEGAAQRKYVTALASKKGIAIVDVEGTNLVETPGGAAKIFAAVASREISMDMISTAQVNISFTVDQKDADSAKQVLENLDEYVGQVTTRKSMALVGVVGENMLGHSSEVSAVIFQTLSRLGVEVRMISKSASDIDITLIVPEKDLKSVLQALHDGVW